MTNLKLKELREKSGAFISQSDFQIIKLEYQQYLQEEGLKDTTRNAKAFIKEWIEEQESWGTLRKTVEGFSYYDPEGGADGVKVFKDYAEKVDSMSFMWKTKFREMCRYLETVLNAGNVDPERFRENYVETVKTISQESEESILYKYDLMRDNFKNLTSGDKQMLELYGINTDATDLPSVLTAIQKHWDIYTLTQKNIVAKAIAGDKSSSDVMTYLGA